MDEMAKLFDVDQLAEFLNVPKSWIYARTREKGADTIPVMRCGKYLRFQPEKVLDWIKSRDGQAS